MARIGRRSGVILDPDRRDWSDKGQRPLAWDLWYPADGETGMPEGDLPDDTPRLFRRYPAVVDAPLAAGEAFPVVLLSHGSGGSAAGLSWIGTRLAAAGYAVIGANHHGNTSLEPYRAEGFYCWWERSRDLSVLLDYHLREGPLGGRLDPARVSAVGFSLGGHAVVGLLGGICSVERFVDWAQGSAYLDGPREFPSLVDAVEAVRATSPVLRASIERQSISYRDPRIRRAAVLAPAPTIRGFASDTLAGIAVPLLATAGGADREAPPGLCAEWLCRQMPEARFEALGADVGHYVFLNECTDWGCTVEPEICVDPPGVVRRAIHQQVGSWLVGHLTQGWCRKGGT